VAAAAEGATVVIAPLEVDPCPAAALVAPEPESTVTGSDTWVVAAAAPAFATPVLATGTETCTELVGVRLLAFDTAFTAATGGGAATAVAGPAEVVGAAAIGVTGVATLADGVTALATVIVDAEGTGAGETAGCATTVEAAVIANTVGVTVTERIVPASTLLPDGAEIRSPFNVPPFVRARRGRSIEAATISARPLTLTVPVLPNEPRGTTAVNPPVIVALPKLTLPSDAPTVRPLETVRVEKVRACADLISAVPAANEMGWSNLFCSLRSTVGADKIEAWDTRRGPDCVIPPVL
jgi:hypothetical protein